MLASVGDQLEAKSGKTYFQLAAEALLGKAFNGDVQAFKEFADRIDGPSSVATSKRIPLMVSAFEKRI